MSAPFRELFVDASEAIMAALRGAFEAKLAERQAEPCGRRSIAWQLVRMLESPEINASLCEQFGFEELIFERSSMHESVNVIGVRSCRNRDHESRAGISDQALEYAADLPSLLLVMLQHMRTCYCVERRRFFADGRHLPIDRR